MKYANNVRLSARIADVLKTVPDVAKRLFFFISLTISSVAFANNAPVFRGISDTLPQFLVEQLKLNASDGAADDGFGFSIASDDGIIVVGAPGKNRVYVFVPDGAGGYTQNILAPAPDEPDAAFGYEVAIDNGKIAVAASNKGTVHVFEPDGAGGYTSIILSVNRFIDSVAIENNTIVAGSSSGGIGRAFLFAPNNSGGYELTALQSNEFIFNNFFGRSVAIENGTVYVGAPYPGSTAAGFPLGRVNLYIFKPNGSGGYEESSISANDGGSAGFGESLAVSNGSFVVGSPFDDNNGSNSGSAYLFKPDGAGGFIETKLTASDGATNDMFGHSVSIEHGTVVVGALQDDDNGTDSGSAYVFEADEAGGFTETKLTARDGESEDEFGFAVSIGNGIVSVGAHYDDDKGSDSGNMFLFAYGNTLPDNYLLEHTHTEEIQLPEQAVIFDADNDELSIALSGDDSDDFTISENGRLLFDPLPNFESPTDSNADNIYQVSVTVTDTEQASSTLNYSVTITDAPDIDGDIIDNDNDGVPDEIEIAQGTDPLDNTDYLDSDNDLVPDYLEETVYGTDPNVADAKDTDGDGIIDYLEDFPGINDAPVFEAIDDAIPRFFGQIKITSSDGEADDQFGDAVAIENGVVVVGAYGDDDNGSNSGSAYVFTPNGMGGFTETKLTASDAEAGDRFGHSAIAIDEGTIVVGAYGDGGNATGSVYVFENDGVGGYEETKLTASDSDELDFFGWSVASDRGTIVVGASGSRADKNVYVFEPDGSGGFLETKLTASDGTSGTSFGNSVAISNGTVVVGAYQDSDNGFRSGSVYVFEPDGQGGYTETKLIASDAEADQSFGESVAVEDGIVVVGAPSSSNSQTGAVYVYTINANEHYTEKKLTASDKANGDRFGESVSINNGTVVAGSPRDDDQGSGSGSIYVFEPDGNGGYTEAKFTNSDGAAGDNLGRAVAIDGDMLVAGIPNDDYNGANSGSIVLQGLSGALPDNLNAYYTHIEEIQLPLLVNVFDPDGDDMTVELSGIDSDMFIVSETGALQFDTVPDFESLAFNNNGRVNVFNVSATVTDGNQGSSTIHYQITVEDSPDSDGDGSEDVIDRDDDEDGVPDETEIAQGTDPLDHSDYLDSDGDLVPDYIEENIYGTDPNVPDATDTDGDGVIDYIEEYPGKNDLPVFLIREDLVPQALVYKAILGPTDRIGAKRFGSSVDIDDGIIAVGAYLDDTTGSVYVFNPDRNGDYITTKLIASDGEADDQFGRFIAIDNGVIVVGVPSANDGAGRAYVYIPDNTGSYTETILVPNNQFQSSFSQGFGSSVAIDDGVVVVGHPRETFNGTGSIYVFAFDADGSYTEQRIVPVSGVPAELFGSSVAIDGGIIVVGATGNDTVHVLTPNNTGSYYSAELTSSDIQSSDGFGDAVDIDNGVIVVGSRSDDDKGINSGSIYLFKPDGNGDYAETKLVASDGAASDGFGSSVSIDNGVIVVGAPFHDIASSRQDGSAYVYVPNAAGGYTETKRFIQTNSGSQERNSFGTSVAVDNGIILVGTPFSSAVGSAITYEFSDVLPNEYTIEYTHTEEIQLPQLVTAFDADGDDLTVEISGGSNDGSNNSVATITDDGYLQFDPLPDFESPGDNNRDNLYQFMVTVTDGKQNSSKTLFYNITITDSPDTDNDGVEDIIDRDDDNDGVPDDVEIAQGTDPLSIADYRDTDGDLVPDYVEETLYFTDPNVRDAIDSDGDGVIDYIEEYPGVNDAPVWRDRDDQPINSAVNLIHPNSRNLVTLENVSIFDPDGDDLTYALSGADQNAFTLSASGELRFKDIDSVDVGARFTVIITATDPDESSKSISLNIEVRRDTDSDGIIDERDAFPWDSRYSLDDDEDGMDDNWETENGLDPESSADAQTDSDADNVENITEFVADTDPDDATSVPQLALSLVPLDPQNPLLSEGDVKIVVNNSNEFSLPVIGFSGISSGEQTVSFGPILNIEMAEQPDKAMCVVTERNINASGDGVISVQIGCGARQIRLQKLDDKVRSTSVVNTTFRATDLLGRPVTGLTLDDFQVTEDSQELNVESFIDIEPATNTPGVFNTVLLMDVSSSVRNSIIVLQDAVKEVFRDSETSKRRILDEQRISLFTFDDEVIREFDFTRAFTDDIEQQIDNIRTRETSTDLYGSIKTGFGEWVEDYSLNRIVTGNVIVLTDGDDTANGADNSPTSIQARRDAIQSIKGQGLFAIAAGDDVTRHEFEDLTCKTGSICQSDRVQFIDDFSQVKQSLRRFMLESARYKEGVYHTYYSSPTRRGNPTKIVQPKDNQCSGSDCSVRTQFSADRFVDPLVPETVIIGPDTLRSGATQSYQIKTRFTDLTYEYALTSETLAALDEEFGVTVSGTNNSSFTLASRADNDDLSLTLVVDASSEDIFGDVTFESGVPFELTINDGVDADLDNCPDIANPGQEDADGDGVGDACGSNSVPTADAGPDQEVNEQTSVSLDGSNSSDSDGTISSYVWEQQSGPIVQVSPVGVAGISFTAPVVTASMTLSFRLTVADDQAATAIDDVSVRVNPVNTAPVADAGDAQTVSASSRVALDGTESVDSDGSIETYAWEHLGGQTIVLANASTTSPTFTAPDVAEATTLTFRLMVTDNEGANDSDDVSIRVEPAAEELVVDAGSDQTVDEGQVVTLNSNVTNGNNQQLIYSWEQTDGMPQVALENSNAATASFTAPDIDDVTTLTFSVTVSYGANEEAIDTVNVTINDTVSVSDSDGDGVEDLIDNCPFGANPDQANFDNDDLGDLCDPDDDNDGMSDAFERLNGLDPFNDADRDLDPDGDGLSNIEEFRLGTNVNERDSDGDGINDNVDANPRVADDTNSSAGQVLTLAGASDNEGTIVAVFSMDETEGMQISVYNPQTLRVSSTLDIEGEYGRADIVLHPDMNDDGVSEFGVFGVRSDQGNEGRLQYQVINSENGDALKKYNWPANWLNVRVLLMTDVTGDGVPEVGMQGINRNNGRPQLLVKNGDTRGALQTYSYPSIFNNPEYVQLSDMNGDGYGDVGLAGNLKRNGKSQIRTVDATDSSNRLRTFNFANNWTDTSWNRLSDSNSDGIDDWGLFGVRKDDGRPQLLNKRGNDPRGMLRIYAWPGDMQNPVFIRIPDMNSDDVDEVAAYGLRSNNRWQLSVRDGTDRSSTLANFGWPNNWSDAQVQVLPDITGDGIIELALLGINAEGDWELVIKNGATRAESRVSLGNDWSSRPNILGVGDTDNDGLINILATGADNNEALKLVPLSQ